MVCLRSISVDTLHKGDTEDDDDDDDDDDNNENNTNNNSLFRLPIYRKITPVEFTLITVWDDLLHRPATYIKTCNWSDDSDL